MLEGWKKGRGRYADLMATNEGKKSLGLKESL